MWLGLARGKVECRSEKALQRFSRLSGGGRVVTNLRLVPNARIAPGERLACLGGDDFAGRSVFAFAKSRDKRIHDIDVRHVKRIVEDVIRTGKFCQLDVSAGSPQSRDVFTSWT